MKKLVIILFLTTALCYADGKIITNQELSRDSLITVPVDPAFSDTINIRDIVQNQINAAQTGIIKSGMNYQVPEKSNLSSIARNKLVKVGLQNKAGLFELIINAMNDFNSKYLNVAVLAMASILILGFVFGRRLIKVIPGKRLKKSINLIRLEKPVFLKNKKLYQLRKKLSETNNIYDITEETVSSKARHLSVGKGELILAAKIKAFQLSKISK